MNNDQRKKAMGFILLMGMVSLFGDITYEGGRSVIGPYLGLLGAGAALIGFVSGLGEFLGYALRLVSGFVADRTKAYWPFVIIGYGLIFSIPLLGMTGHWQWAALFVILERVGKALRSPARDAILSYATKQVGRGWGFAVHEAMDQIGAMTGPLIFSLVFFLKKGYRQGFTLLWIPAILTIVSILIAKRKVPVPEKLESACAVAPSGSGFSKVFWFYTIFTFFNVLGFCNFQIISYHFKMNAVLSDAGIPFFYCLAMAVDGLAALAAGRLYDKKGFIALLVLPFFTLLIPLFAFSRRVDFAVVAIVLWGVVMGVQETIMRAAIADLTHIDKRGMAYGIFNTVYGMAWLIGSVVVGLLYENARNFIPVFVFAAEVISIPVFFLVKKSHEQLV